MRLDDLLANRSSKKTDSFAAAVLPAISITPIGWLVAGIAAVLGTVHAMRYLVEHIGVSQSRAKELVGQVQASSMLALEAQRTFQEVQDYIASRPGASVEDVANQIMRSTPQDVTMPDSIAQELARHLMSYEDIEPPPYDPRIKPDEPRVQTTLNGGGPIVQVVPLPGPHVLGMKEVSKITAEQAIEEWQQATDETARLRWELNNTNPNDPDYEKKKKEYEKARERKWRAEEEVNRQLSRKEGW